MFLFLLGTFKGNSFLTKCQNFQKKMGNIDPYEMEMEMELKQFVQIIMENKEGLITANNFLDYICARDVCKCLNCLLHFINMIHKS